MPPKLLRRLVNSSDESSDDSKLGRFLCYPIWKRRDKSRGYSPSSDQELDPRERWNLKMKEIVGQLQYQEPARPYGFDLRLYKSAKHHPRIRRDTFEIYRFKHAPWSPLKRNPVQLSDFLADFLPFKPYLMAGILVVITSPDGGISPGYDRNQPIDYELVYEESELEEVQITDNGETENKGVVKHDEGTNHNEETKHGINTKPHQETKPNENIKHGEEEGVFEDGELIHDDNFIQDEDEEMEEYWSLAPDEDELMMDDTEVQRDDIDGSDGIQYYEVERLKAEEDERRRLANIGHFHACF